MPFARRAACAVVAVCCCFGANAAARSMERATAHVTAASARASKTSRKADADAPDAHPAKHGRRAPAPPAAKVAPREELRAKALAPGRAERHAKKAHHAEEERSEKGVTRDADSTAKRTSRKDARRQKKKHEPPPRPLRRVRPLPPNATWRAFRKKPWQRGYVTLVGHGKKWSGYLVDKYGDVIPGAREHVSEALASWRTGKHVEMDDRLLALVADVSDEFGGRPIRIVSGYREHSYAPDSKHKTGEAFDFSIPEVPNEVVRDFLRSLPDTGVGYYPNSTHVHLDVRKKPTYWVDYSRPGDRPEYAWNRRVGGFTPTERLLVRALDGIVARARSLEAVGEPSVPEKAHVATSARPAAHGGVTGPGHATAAIGDDAAGEDEREDDGAGRVSADAGHAASLDAGHAPGSDAGLPRAPAASAVTNAE